MSGLTVKQTPLLSPGGYSPTVKTLSGGAGELKPMGGGTPDRIQAKSVTPFRGKSGSNPDTQALLKNVPRTIV